MTARPMLLLATLLAGLAAAPAAAQDPVHVVARGPAEPVAPGETFDVVLSVTVDEPYHIYTHDSPGESVTRTVVEATCDEGVALEEIVHPEGGELIDYPLLGETVEVLHGELEWRARFRVAGDHPGGDAEVSASILYMACDDSTCLLPQEPSFDVTVAVAGGATDEAPGAGDYEGTMPLKTAPGTTWALGDAGARAAGGAPPSGDESLVADDGVVRVEVVPPDGSVEIGAAFDVVVGVRVDPPYHVYTHDSPGESVTRTELRGTGDDGVRFVRASYPEGGELLEFPTLGETYEVVDGSLEYVARFAVAEDRAPGPATVAVELLYMACDDATCLPPQQPRFEVPVTIAARGTADAVVRGDDATAGAGAGAARDGPMAAGDDATAGEVSAGAAGAQADDAVSAGADEVADTEALPSDAVLPRTDTVEDRLGAALGSGNTAAFLWVAVLFGFVSLLTPCVFPMVPVTVAFFSKRAEASRGQAIRYALAYGLGIIATYTGFGIGMALLFGASSVQDFATNPWVNLGIGALFVFFALSLLGFYDLRPPAFLQRRAEAGRVGGQGYMPVFVMGFVFTITAFTCTAPIVGSLLPLLTKAESPTLIVAGMLAFSSAFALPFVLLAMFPRLVGSLPAAGGWMVTVKVVLGFAELVAALKFFSNTDLVWNLQWLVRPAMIVATLFVLGALALYLLGTYSLPHDLPGRRRVLSARTLLGLLVVAASLYLARGLQGRDLHPWVEAYLPPAEYGAPDGAHAGQDPLAERWARFEDDYEGALAEARRVGKPLFVDFTGITCINCRLVEKAVFKDPRFVEAAEDVVLAKLYTDRLSPPERRERSRANQRLMRERFGTVTLPFYVLVDGEGNELGRLSYTEDVDRFVELLGRG